MGRRTNHYDTEGRPIGHSVNQWSVAGKVCLILWIIILAAMFM